MGSSAPAAEEEHGHGHDEAKGHGDGEHHGEAKGAKDHSDARAMVTVSTMRKPRRAPTAATSLGSKRA
jgi:cobalt-zinc-cadmium efflux system membrane fusion protein